MAPYPRMSALVDRGKGKFGICESFCYKRNPSLWKFTPSSSFARDRARAPSSRYGPRSLSGPGFFQFSRKSSRCLTVCLLLLCTGIIALSAAMGSSAKKKRERKKDFQVRLSDSGFLNMKANEILETAIEGRQDEAEGRQSYRYQLSSKR